MVRAAACVVDMKLAVIGAGNMAGAMVRGMLRAGVWRAEDIMGTALPESKDAFLTIHHGLRWAETPNQAAHGAHVVLFATKPDQLADVVAAAAARRVAAWSRCGNAMAGGGRRWVRAMPNTPLQVGCGMTALAGLNATPEDWSAAEPLFSGAGEVVRLEDESQLDAVTALSGSGPAFFYVLIDIMAAAGEAEGLPRATALKLAAQTAVGAGRMLQEAGKSPEELTIQVTSKGGTTEAGLGVLRNPVLAQILRDTIAAAAKRSREMA